MSEGTFVFGAYSAGVDRRAQDYIGELVHELLVDHGITPCAFSWNIVVDWELDEEDDEDESENGESSEEGK